MHNVKRKLAIYGSYLISIIFLYLTLEGVNYCEVLASLSSAHLETLIVASLLYLFSFLLRGVRLRLVLDNKVNHGTAISSNLIAYALNNFLPLKGGDLYKIYFLNKNAGIRKSVSTATVLIERMFDLVSVLLIFIIMLYYVNIDTEEWGVASLLYVFVALITLLLFFIFLVHRYKHIKVDRYLSFVNNDSLHVFLECWTNLLRHRHFMFVLILSLFVWLFEGLVFYAITGFDIMTVALIWMCALALSFVVPNAPGNIGLFEWVTIFVLSAFSYTEEQALSMALLAHAVQFVTVTSIGLLLFFYYKKKQHYNEPFT